jgi:hypothetical protein
MCLAGCASDRLNPAPPQGVNLTGEWQLNPNLSDDPQKPPPDDGGSPSNMRHRSGRGHGGSGGLPPFGLPGGAGGRTGGTEPDGTQDLTSNSNSRMDAAQVRDVAVDAPAPTYVRTLWQFPGGGAGTGGSAAGSPAPGSPAPGSDGLGGSGRRTSARSRSRFGHWLDAPERMTIEQSAGRLTIQSKSLAGELKTDEFVLGHTSDVPLGQSTAERDVGWRGSIFVIDTKVKDGPTKEDDYALDDDGRLIVSTLMTGGHMPKVDIKRVYDRVKGAQGVRQ